MISRMLGAPLGGTTRGGHHGLESLALSLISPPNFIGGGGSCFPSSVTVAPGEPGTPAICWALTVPAADNKVTANNVPSNKFSRGRSLVVILPSLPFNASFVWWTGRILSL